MKILSLLILSVLLLSGCALTPGASSADAPGAEPSMVLAPTPGPAETPAPSFGPSPSTGTSPGIEPSQEPEPSHESVGQTLDELKASVPVELDPDALPGNDLHDEVPEDAAGIIQASAWQWMRYVFTEMVQNGERCPELQDFRCTSLKLLDITESRDLFIYSAIYQFLPYSDSDADFWMAGNTRPSGEPEGWYRFSRQLVVRVEEDGSWEVLEAATGGLSLSDYEK